jgi:hypothetical protein
LASCVPHLAPFPLHGDGCRIADLDPDGHGPDQYVLLRHDALGAEPARMGEDDRPIFGNVLVKQDPSLSIAQQSLPRRVLVTPMAVDSIPIEDALYPTTHAESVSILLAHKGVRACITSAVSTRSTGKLPNTGKVKLRSDVCHWPRCFIQRQLLSCAAIYARARRSNVIDSDAGARRSVRSALCASIASLPVRRSLRHSAAASLA